MMSASVGAWLTGTSVWGVAVDVTPLEIFSVVVSVEERVVAVSGVVLGRVTVYTKMLPLNLAFNHAHSSITINLSHKLHT